VKDLHGSITATRVVAPVAIGTTGTGKTGAVIDTAGYGGVEFIVGYGTVTATNAVFTVVMKEGDVTGTLTSVADADMLGTELLAGLAAASTRTSGVSKNVSQARRLPRQQALREPERELHGHGRHAGGHHGAAAQPERRADQQPVTRDTAAGSPRQRGTT
jgi:hypothetical protein